MRSCSLPTLLAFATIGIGCVPNLDYLENGPRDGGLGGLTGANDSSASGGGAGGRAGSSGGEQDASDAGRGGADAKGDEGDSGLDSSNSGIGGGGSQAGGGGSDGGGRGGGAGAGGGPADAGGDRVGDATNDVGPEVLGPVEPYLTLIPVCNEDGGCESARADSYVNAAPWRHNGLLTVGNYQFIAYYGQYTTSGTYGAIIGRRHINSRTWTLTRTAFLPAGNDWSRAYSSVQFGVDGDGVLHMGWGGTGLTSTRAYYTQSTASVLNDSPMTIIGGDIGNTGSMSEATAGEQFPMESDSSVQYMEFYAIPGSGDLLMPFRTGSTGNGDYQLARWDNSGKVWQAVHASASAPWISGHSATYGSPYINQLAFDSQGVLHASWTFRNSGISANNDFFYARSLDKGLTWVPGDGTTAYPTPMTGSNPPYAVFIEPPPSFNLVNQCGMATDRQDHPVVACWYTPSGSAYRQIMVMWYDGSQWHPSQVSSRTVVDQNPNEPARPLILIDEADRWLVVWRDGRAATNGIKLAYSRSVARDDWRTLDLTTDSLGTWEPVYDVQRWNTDGVLSLYYQRCGLELLSPVSVLEFRAREYFRAAAQGDAGVGADASVDAGKAGGDGGN